MTAPAAGGYGVISQPSWQEGKSRLGVTYICGVDGKCPDVRSGQSLNHVRISSSTADNVNNEATALHVKRQGLGQRQRRRAGYHDHLCASTLRRAMGSSDLLCRQSPLVAFVSDSAAADNDNARQKLMPREPALDPFQARQGHHHSSRRGRGCWAEHIGNPWGRGKSLAEEYRCCLDAIVDMTGNCCRGILYILGSDWEISVLMTME